MTAKDRDNAVAQLRTLITQLNLTPADVGALATTAIQSGGTTGLTVDLTLLSATDWQTVKTFLMDGKGSDDYVAALQNCKAQLDSDAQWSFWLGLLATYKAARLRMSHLGL